MSVDRTEIDELLNQVRASSGKDDVCIICYKNQEERCKELFPSKEIHVIPESIGFEGTDNKIFIIPTDAIIKPIKVIYEGEENFYD